MIIFSVILENVGQTARRENAPPKVVGLESIRVWRIAGAIIPPLVEWKKPRTLALEVCAEADLVFINGEVSNATAELEQQLARVAIALVLLNRILNRLLGEGVLQLEGGDGQAVDEQAEVECELRLVSAVSQLSGDRKTVL